MSSQKDKNRIITFEVRIDTIPEGIIENQQASEAYIETWRCADSCLSNWTLDFGKGAIEFVGDWASVATAAISSHKKGIQILSAKGEEGRQRICDEIQNLPVEETPTIPVKLRGPQEILVQAEDFLRMYLMNCFLALNLSAPGCAMMDAEFQGKSYLNKVELSETNWSLLWDEVWPVIQKVPLAETMKWLRNIRFGKSQLAETPVDRLLTALLRVSDGEMWGPEHVLWLSQALEAILESPVERITSTLQQRLLVLLGLPHSVKKAKKRINEFYALRSRIAHGDFQFVHPVGNEVIDPRINAVYDELLESVRFGMTILVAIAQLLIFQRWQAISFFEQLRGTE